MITKSSPRQPDEVLSHWYAHFDDVRFSAETFYNSVEEELVDRKLPRLDVSRVEYHEGSVLSDKRIYLRLSRERWSFDICAAPIGTGYFFSLRFIERPRSILRFLFLCVAPFLVLGAGIFLVVNYHHLSGLVWLLALALFGLVGFRICITQRGNVYSSGPSSSPSTDWPDIDSYLLNTAVIGGLYERFRANTYFRHDTRLLFHTIVTGIVKKKVEETTAAHGVKYFLSYEYSPILGDLYKQVSVEAKAVEREPISETYVSA